MKMKSPSDQKLESKLHQTELKDPEIFCSSSHKITRMCINPECSKVLSCTDFNCFGCGFNVHPICSSVPITNITTILRELARRQQSFLHRTISLQGQALELIRKSGEQLTSLSLFSSFKENQRKIIEKLYRSKDPQSITGKEAFDLVKFLKFEHSFIQEDFDELLQAYMKEFRKLIEKMLALRQTLISNFLKKTYINSTVLKKDDINMEGFSYLREVLKNPQKLKLLYRASENAFSASAFHYKCDEIPNTVTLVKTEFGKIIGGFSKYSWNTVGDGQYVKDGSRNTFLFSLSLKKKIVPKDQNKLICCRKQAGPCFGAQDLWIGDKNEGNIGDFPNQFNFEGEAKFQRNTNSFKAFTGGSMNKFKIEQYEVFQVIYD